MKIRELKRILTRRGFTLCRQGNHSVWVHPAHPNQRIVLSGADGNQAHPYQVAQVCRGQHFHRSAFSSAHLRDRRKQRR
jgi:predicted RNA binding protein YcfA (HicA-like mRNA interferase family)